MNSNISLQIKTQELVKTNSDLVKQISQFFSFASARIDSRIVPEHGCCGPNKDLSPEHKSLIPNNRAAERAIC